MRAKIELNHKVHVLTRKEELDTVRLAGKVVVVIDILFATTTMVAALARGAADVLPVAGEAEARAAAKDCAEGCYVLSGELYAETLPGFAHPAPLALLDARSAKRPRSQAVRFCPRRSSHNASSVAVELKRRDGARSHTALMASRTATNRWLSCRSSNSGRNDRFRPKRNVLRGAGDGSSPYRKTLPSLTSYSGRGEEPSSVTRSSFMVGTRLSR